MREYLSCVKPPSVLPLHGFPYRFYQLLNATITTFFMNSISDTALNVTLQDE
jgi:hypothetical protein